MSERSDAEVTEYKVNITAELMQDSDGFGVHVCGHRVDVTRVSDGLCRSRRFFTKGGARRFAQSPRRLDRFFKPRREPDTYLDQFTVESK